MNLDTDTQDSLLRRLARVEGQVRAVQKMITDGRECREVIAQVSAASTALDQVGYLNSHKASILIEPALTLRLGPEKFQLQVQVAHSFNVTTSDFPQDDALATAGFIFRFR